MIASKVKDHLYTHHIRYFHLTVDDDKRNRIYTRFLFGLDGYSFQVSDNTINVFETNNRTIERLDNYL